MTRKFSRLISLLLVSSVLIALPLLAQNPSQSHFSQGQPIESPPPAAVDRLPKVSTASPQVTSHERFVAFVSDKGFKSILLPSLKP